METHRRCLNEKEYADSQDAFYKLESLLRIAHQKCEEDGKIQELEDVGSLMALAKEKLKVIQNILIR